jgi:hypothetical protein
MSKVPEVALLWRGPEDGLIDATRYFERAAGLRAALMSVGVEPHAVAYGEEFAARTMAALAQMDGVMVWVDPYTEGRDRAQLNRELRELAASGTWVSAHPDVIDALGTKKVIFDYQDLSWGVDCRAHSSVDELGASIASAIDAGETRVLKPVRGNGGQGVWKVGPGSASGQVFAQDAARRDEHIEALALDEFVGRWSTVFSAVGSVIDQRFVEGVGRGMVRAYVSRATPVGFAAQSPAVSSRGALPPAMDPVFAMAAAKTMFPADEPRYEGLRHSLEVEWLPELLARASLVPESMPAIWDLDFLVATREGEPQYVLCEINMSCVSPFPDFAVQEIARSVAESVAS